MSTRSILASFFLSFALAAGAFAATPALKKVMILTGQSSQYHDWTKSSPLVKKYLEETGLFTVDIVATPPKGGDMSTFATPKFSDYAAVVLIYEGADLPEATQKAFVDYMKNGGGLVTIHDSDNAWTKWPEFNEMIAVGGWGGRTATAATGSKIRWKDDKMVLDSESIPTDRGAAHPSRRDFVVVTRTPNHPIMQGLPAEWMQSNDEIYSNLRGPAKNVTVLATAMSAVSNENEPMLMAISYGKGRVFHTTLGHVAPRDTAPFKPITNVGFIVTLQRGTEWAATGNVTQKVPADFPTKEKTSERN